MKQAFSNDKEPMNGFENLVFVTKNNRPTTQFLVTECIEGILKKIHIHYPDLAFEKFSLHCFRHTFATRWLEVQVPLGTV